MDTLSIMLIAIVLCTPIIWYLVKTETAFEFESFVGSGGGEPAKVGVVSLIRKPIDFKLWLARLRQVGVARLFLRIEDTPKLEDFEQLHDPPTSPDRLCEQDDRRDHRRKTGYQLGLSHRFWRALLCLFGDAVSSVSSSRTSRRCTKSVKDRVFRPKKS